MPIKDVFTNVKENTLIFQYDDSSIAIETENGFPMSICKIADIFLKGVKNYEVHHSKSI